MKQESPVIIFDLTVGVSIGGFLRQQINTSSTIQRQPEPMGVQLGIRLRPHLF